MPSPYLLRPMRTLQQALAERGEPSLRAILDGSFERIYQSDGSFRLREVGSGLYLEELDALGRPITAPAASGPATLRQPAPQQADAQHPDGQKPHGPKPYGPKPYGQDGE